MLPVIYLKSSRFYIRSLYLRYNKLPGFLKLEDYHTSAFANSHSKRQNGLTSFEPVDIKKVLSDGSYKLIYRFPYIVHVRIVCRLKLYQTAFTFALLPIYGHLYIIENTSAEALLFIVGLSAFASSMLYVMGEFFRNFIGAIYHSVEGDSLIVSRLSFFGTRKDIHIPLSDIVPLSDTGEVPSDIYVNVKRYSQPDSKLYLCLRYGGIIEPKLLNEALGNF